MFSNILVAVDGSDAAAHVFETALQLARVTGAKLHPLYVIDRQKVEIGLPDLDPEVVRASLLDQGERVMKMCVGTMARFGVQGIPEIDELAHAGEDVARRIDLAAARLDADLVVMGTDGCHEYGSASPGTVAAQALATVKRPILMVPLRRDASENPGSVIPVAERSRSYDLSHLTT